MNDVIDSHKELLKGFIAHPESAPGSRGKSKVNRNKFYAGLTIDPIMSFMNEPRPEGRGLAQQRGGAFPGREHAEYQARIAQRLANEEWDYIQKFVEELFKQDRIRKGAESTYLSNLSQVTPSSLGRRSYDCERLIYKAIAAGAVMTGPNQCRWDIFGDCSNPYSRTLKAKPTYDAMHKRKRNYQLYIDIQTRCRKCKACLRSRAALWRVRAIAETQSSVRTWMGTLTISPDRLLLYRFRACDVQAKKGQPFESLSPSERFAAVHKEISKDITKSIKRWRKRYAIPFKYLMVTEAHKSGEPHYHLLLHERNANRPARYEMLRTFWSEGFSHWKLVGDGDKPAYLCKYLAKSMLARVRASQYYGHVLDPVQGVEYRDDIRRINYDPYKRAAF